MKPTLDCLACIATQAVRAGRFATTDPKIQRAILEQAIAEIPQMDLGRSPAALSLSLYTTAAQLSGNPDPYKQAKREQNDMALALEADLRDLLRQSEDPLSAALHLAAAGNIIDLGTVRVEDIDIRATVEEVLQQRFSVDHTATLRRALTTCTDLLYLLDNAGEILFDKLLIEELQKYTSVTAVVKAAPMLNDALLEDAEYVGLTKVCPVIDNGGAFIGSPLDLVPEWFLERMHQADVIIGKGQGNYETIDDFEGNVFLILRAKCETIAAHMGVSYGEVALISTEERRAKMCSAQAATVS